jgi:hypothetical protein
MPCQKSERFLFSKMPGHCYPQQGPLEQKNLDSLKTGGVYSARPDLQNRFYTVKRSDSAEGVW